MIEIFCFAFPICSMIVESCFGLALDFFACSAAAEESESVKIEISVSVADDVIHSTTIWIAVSSASNIVELFSRRF